MNKMNPVVHFEMPAKDKKRMALFYEKTFGWKTKMLGPEMGEYVVVSTTDTDEKGMIKTPGAINGGFYEKTADMGDMHPSVVIAVDDIRASMKMVEAGGGKVLGGMSKTGEPDDIPGVGLYVSFIDTEGNRVGMLQPKKM
jgi:hypothetical protein